MKNIIDFEDLLKDKSGEKGTPERDRYEADSLAVRLGVMLKEARKEAHFTQEEFASKTGTNKAIFLGLKEDKVISRFRHFTNWSKLD